MACCLFACFCLVRLSDQAWVYFCVSIHESLFFGLWVSLTACVHSICICVYFPLCASLVIAVAESSQWTSRGLCFCFSIYPCVYLPPSLLFSASEYGLCLYLSCLLAPIYVGISVSTFLFMSLCWACLWESRQTREAPMIYTLSQTQYVSEKTQGNDLVLYCLQIGLQLTYSMGIH